MGKKSAPAAPDYTAAAEKQAEAGKELTTQQTWANRPNLTTPWGSQTWNATAGTDPATGQPITNWASQIQLSPDQQAALDSQMSLQSGRSDAALDKLGQATDATSGAMDYSQFSKGADPLAAPELQTSLTNTAGDWRQKAQDATLAFQKPLHQQAQAGLENQLSNMGLTRGSEAWNSELRNLNDRQARDQLQAFSEGRQEADMLFGQDLASAQFGNAAKMQELQGGLQAGGFNQTLRQQQIAEMLQQRGQPLNELNALLTGQQVQNPQMPGFSQAGVSQAPNYMGATENQYQSELDAYNAKQAGVGSTMSGLFGLGSAAMGNPLGLSGLFKF